MEQYKIGDKVITPYGEEAEIMSDGFGKGNINYYAVEYGDGRLGILEGGNLRLAEIPFDPSKMSFKISIEDKSKRGTGISSMTKSMAFCNLCLTLS